MATESDPLGEAELGRQQHVTLIVSTLYTSFITTLILVYALVYFFRHKLRYHAPHTSSLSAWMYRPLMPQGPGLLQYLHLGKLLLVICLFGINLLFILVVSVTPRSGVGPTSTVLNRVGAMAVAHIPIVVLLAGRNNVVSFITGVPYLELRFMHKALGVIGGLEGVIHGLGHAIQFDTSDGISSATQTITSTSEFQGGVIAVTGMLLLVLSGLHFFRSRFYEAFLLLHICGLVLIIVGLFMHFPYAWHYMIPVPVIIFIEVVFGIFKTVHSNKMVFRSPFRKARLSLVGDAIVVRVSMPNAAHWGPEHHAYISFHKPRFFGQTHPFSIANVSQLNKIRNLASNDMLFVIKVRDGLTRRLHDYLIESPSMALSLPVTIHGIYDAGAGMPYLKASRVIALAVGSGVTHTYSIIQDVLSKMLDGESTPLSDVRFVWVIRHIDQFLWIAKDLQAIALLAADSSLPFQFDIFFSTSSFTQSTTRILQQTEKVNEGDYQAYQLEQSPEASKESGCLNAVDSFDDFLPLPEALQSMGKQIAQLSDGPELAKAVANLSGLNFPPNITFYKTKPDVCQLLREYVQSTASSVSVHVCGPTPFANKVSLEAYDLRRSSPLDLHVASFEC